MLKNEAKAQVIALLDNLLDFLNMQPNDLSNIIVKAFSTPSRDGAFKFCYIVKPITLIYLFCSGLVLTSTPFDGHKFPKPFSRRHSFLKFDVVLWLRSPPFFVLIIYIFPMKSRFLWFNANGLFRTNTEQEK